MPFHAGIQLPRPKADCGRNGRDEMGAPLQVHGVDNDFARVQPAELFADMTVDEVVVLRGRDVSATANDADCLHGGRSCLVQLPLSIWTGFQVERFFSLFVGLGTAVDL